MREYLFRGKRKSDGEWVLGHLCYNGALDSALSIQVVTQKRGEIIWKKYAVIPETVGQFVGINDINAVKMFEKDIVKVSYRIRDEDGNYIKKQENRLVSLEHSSFGLMSIFGEWPMGYMCEPITVEVIGNVIDTPSLLESKND